MTALATRLQSASAADIAFLDAETKWLETARAKQVLPIDGWSLALAQAGRGFGKTAMGSSLVRRWVGLYPGCVVHVIAPTYGDLRGVVFNGVSGLLTTIPAPMIASSNQSTFEIKLWNGSLIRGFSAESPDRLRGPQCTFLWGDELASWGAKAEEMLTNIDMSTRIAFRTADGRIIQPQRFYSTTPRPLLWLKKMADRANIFIRGSTYENKRNLARDFLMQLSQYEGTQIGRQEIHGELLDIAEAAIIKRSWLNIWPNTRKLPWFEYVMVSMDTALTEKNYDKKKFEADPTACQVWGVFAYERKWNVILLNCWADMHGFPALVMAAKKEMRMVYGRRTDTLFKPVIGDAVTLEQEKKPDLLIIEDKGSGISLRQMLAQEGIDSYPYNPGNADKLARLHAISHVAAAGRIWLPESTNHPGEPRDWIAPMLDEVCVYSGPGTTPHDDHVDSFSQAMRFFADRWLNTGANESIRRDQITANVDIDDADLAGVPSEDLPRGYQNHDQPMGNPYDA